MMLPVAALVTDGGIRMGRLQMVEDEISRKIAEAERSGEFRQAPSYGRPMRDSEGWDEAPAELRMAFKILKDGGFVPPEVVTFHERARLRARIAAATDAAERARLSAQLAELEARIAIRLESLQSGGSL